jgi:cytochrome c biogenesis protein CcdA
MAAVPGFDLASYAVGYVAGVLSTLSPCVLPLLPILLASALAEHRHGPLALALGLTTSFTSVGLFTATVGLAIGLDAQQLRPVAAVVLMVFGALLVVPGLRQGFERVSAGLGDAGDAALARLHRLHVAGWPGQFAIGALLGLVWTPCVGPTLGAATTLAVQRTQLPAVALVLLVFGLGASTPLVLLGGLSKAALARWRARLLDAGGAGRHGLGALMLVLGVLVLTGLDKRAEALLLEVLPAWLSRLATRY